MKFKIIRHPFHSGKIISTLCCLNCDKPMARIEKGIKIGRQLDQDGWYCTNCKFFFFEIDSVMYYCRVKNKCQHDIYERCKEEHFAIFVKKNSTCYYRTN